jgi:hypothetical protein
MKNQGSRCQLLAQQLVSWCESKLKFGFQWRR